jgi:hypothetical protein
MKIALMHYHLKPGGITTVIRQQLKAIGQDCETLLITGEPPENAWSADTVHIPGIAYTRLRKDNQTPEAVADAIQQAIFAKWQSGCDILHVHNPLLKKNEQFLNILKALQRNGLTLFLQIHDFAEDGRPDAYYSEAYPADCHYGVINSRDYQRLLRTGLCARGLHRIYNTVKEIHAGGAPSAVPRNSVVYPIRAIRRKNIGEAILISLFFKNQSQLRITLPPNSLMDVNSYHGWQRFSAEQHLPVEFDAGVTQDFSELISSADFLISTSISEGFGFSFLEPWTAGRCLWGRDLPEITIDFKTAGIQLDHLYPQLRVPISADRKERLAFRWQGCVALMSRRFGLLLDQHLAETAFASMTRNDLMDFGMMDESFQKEIIQQALVDKIFKASLVSLNPFLADPGEVPDAADRIEKNRAVIQKEFGQTAYKDKLMRIYEKVRRETVVQHINKDMLLESFLDLNHFSLLKWGDYEG